MSSSPPPLNRSSSPTRPPPPLRSSRLQANPNARAYLVPRAASGQDILVTLEEAREWFQHGYIIRDPDTGLPVDIGRVPVPSYSEGQGAFVREESEERRARDALAKEEAKKDGNGRNGYSNEGSGGAGGGTAA